MCVYVCVCFSGWSGALLSEIKAYSKHNASDTVKYASESQAKDNSAGDSYITVGRISEFGRQRLVI